MMRVTAKQGMGFERAHRGAWTSMDMLSRIRNRFFMAGGFQRWASSTPIVRGIARRRAARLFDLCAGFVYSQVLAALVDIDIFETLRSGPVAPGLVASRADLSEEAFMRLAKAGEALGLLQRFSRGRIGLGPQGAALLGNPSVFAMIKHHRLLYDDLADPLSVWRSPRGATKLGHFWGYGTGEAGEGCAPGDGKAYSALMATTQRFVSEEILAAHDFRRYQRVLDVGGGTGQFLITLAKRTASSELWLFDLPEIAAQAEGRFTGEGLAHRARVVPGDFHTDPLPGGADALSLVRILHDHDDEAAQRLLCAAHHALQSGGDLIVAEPMADTKGAAAMGDAYFGTYLWALGSGRPRNAQVLASMMRKAGFRKVRLVPTRMPLLTSILIGRK